MTKVGFTGTRQGMTEEQIETFNTVLDIISRESPISEFHHGDCRGADEQADDVVLSLHGEGIQIKTVIHPPDNDLFRAFCIGDVMRLPQPYLVRNKDIVNESSVMIVAPEQKDEQVRSGTWSTYRYAKNQGRDVFIIYPDGSYVRENESKL